MNKSRYISRFLLALGITLLLTWAAYAVVIRYDRQYFNSISKNEYMLLKDTTYYDILLMGSSRMKNNVNPRYVDSITGLNCYNAGASGANTTELSTILNSYLLRHRAPKYIVLSLDLFSMESFKHLQYYPNYLTCSSTPPVRRALREDGVPTGLYRFLPFLKIVELNDYYKSVVIKAIKGETDIAADDYEYKGFVSNTAKVITEDRPGKVHEFDISEKGVEALGNIILTCREHNIELSFVFPPEYKRLNMQSVVNAEKILATYDSLAMEYSIPFYHDEYLEINERGELFANNGHLNRNGAEIYSAMFAQALITRGIVNLN